ncbi:uncharacterized protein A4U43_C07F30800 [Asparagus officinalis]|uniref:Uncharacterized protein n=1 Tax=Asparagus officinalis TaxID=4686 RepID=A0A5P1EG36_ASPOF|nr:uncharacterized protein A4U43_C07F30800 [Asparagus officinalis]
MASTAGQNKMRVNLLKLFDKIKYLFEEVKAEKHERLYAQECARLDFLDAQRWKEIEMKGGGLVLDEENGDKGDKESEEGSTRDDQDEKVVTPSPRPTLAPESGTALPSPITDPSRAL